jgi:hypothetical protein
VPGAGIKKTFFFFIREISLKSEKRNQVHRKYTRKAGIKKTLKLSLISNPFSIGTGAVIRKIVKV